MSSNARDLASFATANAAGSSFGFKNRIINGDMRIDQRNNGAAVTPASGPYIFPVDRWQIQCFSDGSITGQRVTDAPTGFAYSLKMTVNTADTSLAADQLVRVWHVIEANNCSDLGLGTAAATQITLSFWVKSSLTGTFAGNFSGGDALLNSYVFTYTINAANTWEYKIITISGHTAGTWLTGNLTGLAVLFDLGTGTNYQGAANTWVTGDYNQGTASSVKLIGTSGATFYITGVQLEKGATATPFEFRSIGQELALCQRYWRKNGRMQGIWIGISSLRVIEQFVCTMRAAPTLSIFDAGAYHEHWNMIGYNGIATIGYSLANDIGIDTVLNSSVNRSRNYGDPAMLESGALAYSAEL